MKSTPTRGVKQTLKPNAYKQWEPSLQIALKRDPVRAPRAREHALKQPEGRQGKKDPGDRSHGLKLRSGRPSLTERFDEGVTTYLLYNGSAT